MHRTSRGSLVACATAACSLLLIAAPVTVPAQAAAGPVVDPAIARSPELSETTRLSDRRFVVTGDRAWALGTADGRYPAAGFHTRGEMGGFWLPNLKLLDGMWFGINGDWIGPATKTTSGWGYVRTDLPVTNGVQASRTDFVPDGVSGALVGLSLRANRTRTIDVTVDAHSELLGSYPWGETTPSQLNVNLPDTVRAPGTHLAFRDRGTPPNSNSESHDWAAAVGSDLTPSEDAQTGEDFRGPQDPAVICPASGPDAPPQPERCDDTEYGKGVGGRLAYTVRAAGRRGEDRLVRRRWIGRQGRTKPSSQLQELLTDPCRRAGRQGGPAEPASTGVRSRPAREPAARQDSVRWSKQMLAASVQEVENARLRETNAGQELPAAGRHPGLTCAGSVPAGRTTPGCSARTASTPRSPRSRPGSSARSRTICGRCATCRWTSTVTAARSCMR